MDTIGLVLAAGASLRMGSPKALLEWKGETFVSRAVRVLLEGGAGHVRVIVGGPHREDVENEVSRLSGSVEIVVNDDPEDGPISSVRAGISAEPGARWYAILPVDIPGVQPSDVRALVDAASVEDRCDVVAPSVDMRRGHPLLIGREAALCTLEPDGPATLRELLRTEGVRILHVTLENRGLLRDVDTPSDLEALRTETETPPGSEPR